MQGGTGGCRPPARGSGGLEAPQEQRVKQFDGEKVKPLHPFSDKAFERLG